MIVNPPHKKVDKFYDTANKWCLVGKIKLPPNGDKLIFDPQSTAKIPWTFDITEESELEKRSWYFTSSDGMIRAKKLAVIEGMKDPVILNSGLTGVSIEENATLVLKNVNQSYDGEYIFVLLAGIETDSSTVVVTIAGNS